MKSLCYIAGAGEFSGLYLPCGDDYVIAADAGYTELVTRGIVPDLVIGDFDSLGVAPDHPNVVHISAEKDDTDMMLAVRQGLSHGYKTFIIDGGLGGRLDQTFANLQILVFLARNGARGILLGQVMCATAVTDGTVGFAPGASGVVSVFCAGCKAEGVTITGLKYPLSEAALTCDYPLGVSNEFTGASAMITVRDGTLVVIWTGGPGLLML